MAARCVKMSKSSILAVAKNLGYFLAGITIGSIAVRIAIEVSGEPFQTKALGTIPAILCLYIGYKVMNIPVNCAGDSCE